MQDGDGRGADEGAAGDGGATLPPELAELIRAEARALGRFAAASIGGADADALARDVIVSEWQSSLPTEGTEPRLSRARLFSALRKKVAHHVEEQRRKNASGEAPRTPGATPLLAALRPTEREALLLRYVAGLSAADVALASGSDETVARQRLSRALSQLCATERGASLPEAPADVSAMRRRVEDHLSDILDGLASDDVADFVADDDAARDLVYDAERRVDAVRGLAGDHTVDVARLCRDVARGLSAKAPPAEAVHEEEPAEEPKLAAPSPATPADAAAPAKEVGTSAKEPGGDAQKSEASTPDGTPPQKDERPLFERLGRRGRLAAVLGSAAALVAFVFAASRSGGPGSHDGEAWSGKVDRVSLAFGGNGGLERCSPDRAVCSAIGSGDDVPAGSTLRTDGRTRAVLVLADGTHVALDRETELRLDGQEARRARLDHGSVVLEVLPSGGSRARLDVPLGFVESAGAKLSLSAGPRRVALEVVRGAVRLVDAMERGVAVHAGETGRLEPGRPPEVEGAPYLGSALRWSERAFGEREEASEITGLGELRAKKPGEDRERKGAVTLASHLTKVRIVGNVARTEIEEEFSNGEGEVLEGIFRFPLPPDAQIERLALDVDGKMVDGAFVDRERASAIWRGAIVNAGDTRKPQEEIVWVPGPWRDPALLEWQRGGRFELRIYPIPKHGSRRVLLSYTQVIPPSGGERRYVYPLPHDPSGSTKVSRFDVDVQVRGHDDKAAVRAEGYPFRQEKLPDGAASLVLHAEGFSPSGDLSIAYALPDADHEVTAWAYQPGPDEIVSDSGAAAAPGDAFVALSLRPKLPLVTDGERRSFALVVDSSRSMFGERYRRATELLVRLAREMDSGDVATVLACDSTCQELPSGPASGGPAFADAARAFLGKITPEGGSDVSGAIRRAAESLRSAPRGSARIVYVGDGTPTIGPVQPAFVEREIAAVVPRELGSVTTVAIGSDADVATLGAIAEAGGGVLVPYAPGQTPEEAAYAVLGATYGHALSDIELDLPEGLSDVLPKRLATIAAGGEAIVTARLSRSALEGTIRLRGKVGGAPFEQRYPLRVEATTAKGNGFVPRLWAAAKIADLEKSPDAGSRKRAVELSGRFHVASRYTSLLVLESSAMFQAFGLDRQSQGTLWTGEDDATSTTADGEVLADDKGAGGLLEEAKKDSLARDLEASPGSLGSLGTTGGSGVASNAGGSARASAAPAAAAPAKRKAEEQNPYDADERSRGYAPPPPAPALKAAAPGPGGAFAESGRDAFREPEPLASSPFPLEQMPRQLPPRRRFIPMRKVWDRVGRIVADAVPGSVTADVIARAVEDATGDVRRDAVKRLYTLELLAGHLDRAGEVAERWSTKDPLDPDALTARADVAAARGDRDLAIRILGSVVDVRPGDHKAQWRLARLHRWAGRAELGCRHSLAVAQIRPNDAKLLAEAVRCARDVGHGNVAGDLLSAADDATRRGAEVLLAQPAPDPSTLAGDLQVQASWSGGDDLDLAMLPPDGYRVSWLGAPTRAIITARDVESTSHEGLALNGAAPGDYVVEITRPNGHRGVVRGSIDVVAAGERRTLPFVLDGTSTRVALVKITTKSRLVPL